MRKGSGVHIHNEPRPCVHCGTLWRPKNTKELKQRRFCSRSCGKANQYVGSKLTDEQIAEKKRINKLRLDFNMTPAQYDALLVKQGGGCAICGGVDKTRRLNVDHDHNCCPGRTSCGDCVRGLLCINCNLTLGTAKDSPELLRKAINYLNEYGAAQ